LATKALDLVFPRSETSGDCPLTNTVPAGGQHSGASACPPTKARSQAAITVRSAVGCEGGLQEGISDRNVKKVGATAFRVLSLGRRLPSAWP